MEAYPLHWPIGYKRTSKKIGSRFKVTMDTAQRFLRSEIKRLGGIDLIVSSNVPVRKDGGLYSDWMSRKIDDPGVAIYFKYNGKEISMCCDQYSRVYENVYALGKGIEALRGMERWGVSDFLEKAFTGFTALPESKLEQWFDILNVDKTASADEIQRAYRKIAMKHHPDVGGSPDLFIIIQKAYNEGLAQLSKNNV